MYTIMIVDDEDEVREGMKRKTDWASCGFELVGDYSNGRDAWEAMMAMESRPADVVITDICMPFMDGLELTECITAQYRDVLIVIVTGYEDFEYAQQAIKLKVNDYLLKPITAQEFTDFLITIKLVLDEERKKKEDVSQLKLQLNQSFPLLRERFLERMATSFVKQEELERKFNYFQLSLAGPSYLALIVDIDDFAHKAYADPYTEIELLRFAVFNIVQEIYEKEYGGVVFRTRDDKIAILFSASSDDIVPLSQTLAEQVRYSVEKYLKLSISIGIGRRCHNLPHISTSFQEAVSALDYRFLLGKNRVITIDDLEAGKSAGAGQVPYNEWEKKLLAALKTGQSAVVSQALHQWMDDLKSHFPTIHNCYGSIHKFLASLMNFVAETGFNEPEIFADPVFPQIYSMKTLDEVGRWLEDICQQTLTFLSEKRDDMTTSQIHQAKAYIREHYMDEKLSLNHVCSHVYLSMSYFSSLFKQHTGETFVEYLTRIRLEKAKELIVLTQLKSYEIAARVGYGDPQYFSVIFKRNLGMTPKEYRASQKGSSL